MPAGPCGGWHCSFVARRGALDHIHERERERAERERSSNVSGHKVNMYLLQSDNAITGIFCIV